MNYTVNEEPRSADTAPSVAAVVAAETGREVSDTEGAKGVAVAVNRSVVPASEWGRALQDGDVLDILIAVQGG
ncbi:sulfur carrier protein ThiS [uncultured Corynebacterium sp.]|uniref:sulfur carrier protein ThiS n=1 Tax=uncultured Corynebacterium sp. TaxID=159447 RepID=UPI0025E49A64|nr:sulfur carrier protein ThiS [uncultured Corynebacterium sp.]